MDQTIPNQTIFVVDVDGAQALGATREHVNALIDEKYHELINKMWQQKSGCADGAVQRTIYLRVEVTEHETGKTGWRKAKR